jgi:ribonuclease P protein component
MGCGFPRSGTSVSGFAMTTLKNADLENAGRESSDRRKAISDFGRPRQSMSVVRLRRHADYQRAYAAGRKSQSASMSWFLAPQVETASGPRVGLTAGKVLGKAHERNRIKRRMREALRRHVGLLPHGFDLILHPRRAVLNAEFPKLEAEVVRILQQANAEAARMTQQAKAKPTA